MTAKTVATTAPSAWNALLVAARAVYLQEAERLAEELKPRILMGEFSEMDEAKQWPRHMNLAEELERSHPWLKTDASQRMVLACSDWPEREWRMLKRADLGGACAEAHDCLAHEILAVAARRGWVKPLTSMANDAESYPVRVPYPEAA